MENALLQRPLVVLATANPVVPNMSGGEGLVEDPT